MNLKNLFNSGFILEVIKNIKSIQKEYLTGNKDLFKLKKMKVNKKQKVIDILKDPSNYKL